MDLWMGLAVVVATLLGPVLAVVVTRNLDESRDIRHRRMDVFRMLMRTRRAALSVDHVTALNMVEIEFHGVTSVLNAFRALLAHLNNTTPNPDWWTQRERLLTRLLTEMAQSVGYKMEQLDVLDGGYYPRGWGETEQEQQEVRRLFIELLNGRRSIPVRPGAPSPEFPPAAPPPPTTP